MTNVQAVSKLLEDSGRKALGEDIDVLGCRRNMEYPNMTEGDPLTNKMEINLNMLCPLMLYGVAGEVNNTNVITINQSGTARRVAKLHEQLAQPGGFGDTIGNSSVFGLCTRPGHCMLTFG